MWTLPAQAFRESKKFETLYQNQNCFTFIRNNICRNISYFTEIQNLMHTSIPYSAEIEHFCIKACGLTWRRVVSAECAIQSVWIVCVVALAMQFCQWFGHCVYYKSTNLAHRNMSYHTAIQQVPCTTFRFPHIKTYPTKAVRILQKCETSRT